MKEYSESTKEPVKTNYPALYTLVTVFFFWGFFAAGNSIFIPFCKHYFHLDQFQSQLIDFAFYTAYYLGSLVLFLWSSFRGYDLIAKWGFKKSIVYGLLFSAFGAVLMIVAVQVNLYTALLIGLFVVALGFSLQQIAANPLAILLGDPKTGASRVNLGGGVNSFGTMIGPLIMAFALFGTTASVTDDQIKHLGLDKMTMLYGMVGFLFLIAAGMFHFSTKVPSGIVKEKMNMPYKAIKVLVVMTVLLLVAFIPVFNTYGNAEDVEIEKLEKVRKALLLKQEVLQQRDREALATDLSGLELSISQIKKPLEYKRMFWLIFALVVVVGSLLYAYRSSSKNKEGWGAMQYPQLVLGMIGIFMYVGVEVGIGSNLGELLRLGEFGALQSSEIAPYISMYWGSLMIGRWAGAVSVFKLSKQQRRLALIVVPLLGYGAIIIVNKLAGHDIAPLYNYLVCVFLQIILTFWSQDKATKTLLLFSTFGIAMMCVGLFSSGMVAIYAFLAGGLACSIMWPAIFNLSVIGLGKYTAQGSSFLVMMILGGGIVPPLQGKLADIIGIHSSYWVSVLCFSYLLFFTIASKRILLKQGINIDHIG